MLKNSLNIIGQLTNISNLIEFSPFRIRKFNLYFKPVILYFKPVNELTEFHLSTGSTIHVN